MILYHGSTKDFNKFEIAEKHLSTSNKDNLVEGMGIYFADNKEFVESYGNIIYTVEMDEKDCWDFTKKATIENFISTIAKKVNFPIRSFMSEGSISGILEGDISIRNFSREIMLQLDSHESFYLELGEKDSDQLFDEITDEYNKMLYLKRFFKYFDKSFKSVIYLCTNNEDTVKIISKERVED